MDTGTAKFALYYKDWLKFGGQAPPTPSVPLPWKPTYARSTRRSSDSSTSFHSTSNKSLYQAVFGPIEKGRSMDLDNGNEDCKNVWDLEENYMSNNETVKHDANIHVFELNDTTRAISTICSSESLRDCEMAIRTVSVIQGIMEVLYVSNDDEILELAISILAELATKSEMNKRCILNSDPQLDVSIRLLRSNSLFLKAAALLYLVKPKAKQMISLEWVPLVLRVLEFGFDEDKNLENARQIISVGGLSLLVRRMGEENSCEKSRAASVLHYCIQADGSCRNRFRERGPYGCPNILLVDELSKAEEEEREERRDERERPLWERYGENCLHGGWIGE
ncbi:UNVERIFIED_CONTAM: hypothetical protein Scaly_3043900 [Sesamum calycinum]|uniref:Uncharacterized protein n=1 Tax=Sesamum calycinum TaxID=2727403 RepID=A0AAW2K7S0_9LAMI